MFPAVGHLIPCEVSVELLGEEGGGSIHTSLSDIRISTDKYKLWNKETMNQLKLEKKKKGKEKCRL